MTREEILEYFKGINYAYNDCTRYDTLKRMIDELQELCNDMGEVSDGYHTFNQLYHQRAVLFATIVNQNKDKSWKSFKHSDGKYCFDSNGEWFIVGIDTPQGSYTYHYAKDYWDMFDCEELECGKEWDGHTEEDVTRLLSLQNDPAQVELEGDGYADGELVYDFGKCPKCGWEFEEGDKDWEEPFCCRCGQKLHWPEKTGDEG